MQVPQAFGKNVGMMIKKIGGSQNLRVAYKLYIFVMK